MSLLSRRVGIDEARGFCIVPTVGSVSNLMMPSPASYGVCYRIYVILMDAGYTPWIVLRLCLRIVPQIGEPLAMLPCSMSGSNEQNKKHRKASRQDHRSRLRTYREKRVALG